jgi:Domain of unknown function (DUF4351)
MSELKRYWIVVHYETELTATDEGEACQNICMGNTIVEGATIAAKELPPDADCQALLAQARVEARRESSISIIVNQLCHKMNDYSLIFNGLPTAEKAKLDTLSLEQLENLSIAALHFSSLDDLRDYLA